MGLTTRHHAQAGVSTAEVLAAVALALALALILLPKMARSKRAANESAAVAIMKEISQAELAYAATYPAVGFAGKIEELGGRGAGCVARPERACLLEATVADAPHVAQGYTFAAEAAEMEPRTAFFSHAVPVRVGDTGQLTFCSTNRWAIHYRADGQQVRDGETCEALAVLR